MCIRDRGSDTGGSIRQPAGFCGVVGMKPTYGTVSRYGLIAYGSSLDQIGPLCRDVSDCAAVLEAISSHDTKDSTSMERETDFTSALTADVSGMRIGIPREMCIRDRPTGLNSFPQEWITCVLMRKIYRNAAMRLRLTG